MKRTSEILNTIRMFQEEHLDVRTVTLGISLIDCVSPDIEVLCKKIKHKIKNVAGRLVEVCDSLEHKYGIPIVNKRIAITPISLIMGGHSVNSFVEVAFTLDEIAKEVKVDFIGGFSALVHKASTPTDINLITSLPQVLSETERVCASVNVASTKSGINMDAIASMGEIIKEIAQRTANCGGFGCAKLVVFSNIPEDNPFMAGAIHGVGEADNSVNIGVSGPGVVKRALERRIKDTHGKIDLGMLAEEIKTTAFRVTRVGELIGREVAEELGVNFGIVDLSLAPTPRVGDSVGEILQVLGIKKLGAPGSTAALALLNDAVKKGGAFASSSVGGLSGAFIPVSEDHAFSDAVGEGSLVLEKLEAMTSVCSVGLDMIPIPGDVSPQTISAIIADEIAIGVINNKTTGVRIIPVPGKKAGEKVFFGGLFGESIILEVRNIDGSKDFINYGGRIPAPLVSLNN